MGAYKYIRESIQNERAERSQLYKSRIVIWRQSSTVEPVDRPSNIVSARKFGYKAKQGYVCTRVRIAKGRRKRRQPPGGRSAKHSYMFANPSHSHQLIAEQKANRKYPNCEVLGSYLIADDGQYKFFEVVLADRENKASMSSTTNVKGRAFRGLTSAGRKGRRRLKTRKSSDKKSRETPRRPNLNY